MRATWQNLCSLALVSWLFSAIFTISVAFGGIGDGPFAVDSRTGLAISGFDPVAYLAEGRAREGQARHEARVAGVVWRFVNEGNRSVFERQTEIYLPSFGGHDAVAAANGFIAPGDPALFLVVDDRVYLFQTPENLAAFRNDPRRIIARARHLWPRIVEQSRR